jgi:polysaccharide biosynthesis transport protein
MSTDFSTDLLSSGPPEGGGQFGGRTINIKRMLHTRGPMMAVVAIVVFIPAAVASWLMVEPEFTAEARIQIASTVPSILGDRPQTVGGDYQRFMQTQVDTIRSSTIMSKVVNDPAIRDLAWVQEQPDPLYFLLERVNARVMGGSEQISITCQSPDREAAIRIVDKVVEVFMAHVTNVESQGTGTTRRLLVEERDNLEELASAKRRLIAELKREAGVVGTGSTPTGQIGLDSVHAQHKEAESDITREESSIALQQAMIARMERLVEENKADPGKTIHEMGIEERVLADAAVALLRSQEASTAQRVADLEGRYTIEGPQLISDRKALQSVREQLEEAKSRVRSETLQMMLEQQRLDLELSQQRAEDARSRVAKFKAFIDEHEARLQRMAGTLASIEEEGAALELLSQKYEGVRERIRQIDVDERAPGRVQPPSATTAPSTASNGRRYQLIVMSFVGAIGLGIALGLWRELVDQSIRSPQDIAFITDVPVMGVVPHLKADRLPSGTNPALVTSEYPESTLADEFRRVITRIIYPPEGSAELNTVLVTAPARGDGKTTVACNLAIALAQANRRVLLLDVSARRPSVEKCFGLERAEGLWDVFKGLRKPHEVVRSAIEDNLYVLGPGLQREAMTTHLASREAVEFLEEAEKAFDHVIIDTPPVLFMSDAKLLAPILDGVIVVTMAGGSSTGMLRRTVRELNQVNANLIGVVLNGVMPTRGGYMRENLQHYYAYGSDTGKESHAPRRREAVMAAKTGGAPPDEADEDSLASIVLVDDEGEEREGDHG